MGQMCLVKII